MGLTIVGCGYLGRAVALQLQTRRPELKLTLTTTRTEQQGKLANLADERQGQPFAKSGETAVFGFKAIVHFEHHENDIP